VGPTAFGREDDEFRRKILDLHRKLSDVDEEAVAAARVEGRRAGPGPQRLEELELLTRRAEGSGPREEPPAPRRKRVEFEDSRLRDVTSESSFLDKLRARKRGLKLLSFLGSRGQEAGGALEERAARLMKIYGAEKAEAASLPSSPPTSKSSGPNTIAIHHTSRDRRFWKLRNRRRSSST
jgi:hypothetical protein